jgi:hypothetical protein
VGVFDVGLRRSRTLPLLNNQFITHLSLLHPSKSHFLLLIPLTRSRRGGGAEPRPILAGLAVVVDGVAAGCGGVGGVGGVAFAELLLHEEGVAAFVAAIIIVVVLYRRACRVLRLLAV